MGVGQCVQKEVPVINILKRNVQTQRVLVSDSLRRQPKHQRSRRHPYMGEEKRQSYSDKYALNSKDKRCLLLICVSVHCDTAGVFTVLCACLPLRYSKAVPTWLTSSTSTFDYLIIISGTTSTADYKFIPGCQYVLTLLIGDQFSLCMLASMQKVDVTSAAVGMSQTFGQL